MARLPLTATSIEDLLGRLGTLQGTRGRAPVLPQGTPAFTERMEDVERVVKVGQTDREPASTLEFHPFAKP
jgi:hypothetical protein